VAGYRFTNAARADLLTIGRYTLENWGPDQYDRYLALLQAVCRTLAETAGLGRPYRGQYLRSPGGSHFLFFRRTAGGDVVIVRVLHKRMLPELHFDPRRDDEDDE
jgi:toxin ParE1/3/4